MFGCLTQEQVDGASFLMGVGVVVALVGVLAALLAWDSAPVLKPYDRRRLLAIPLVVAVLAAMVVNEGWRLVLTSIGAAVPVLAVVVVERHRALAVASGASLTPGWQRAHQVVKYGSIVLVSAGFLVAVGAFAWVMSADVCS